MVDHGTERVNVKSTDMKLLPHCAFYLLSLQARNRHLVGPLYNWILVGLDYDLDILLEAGIMHPGDRVVVLQTNYDPSFTILDSQVNI